VVIPTYNERRNLERLLPRVDAALRDTGVRTTVVIVDDNSTDGTADAARGFCMSNGSIEVIVRQGKLGLGSAILRGLSRGFNMRPKASFFFQMDADLSHPPELLDPLYRFLSEDRDLVVGSRYVRGGRVFGWPVHRRVISRTANAYATTMLGLPVSDATSGYKGYTREVVSHLLEDRIESEGYAFQVEMLYRLVKAGFTLDEYPIGFVERSTGESKLGLSGVLEFLYVVPKIRFLSS
jgi:dolichol-phosphate mannosyltransferase